MKYYIATSTERVPAHNKVRDELQKMGYQITYDWTSHGSVRLTSTSRLKEVAGLEMQGIFAADFVLVLLPGGKGTHVELGLSLARGKKIFIHSEDPSVFEIGPQVCAFYHAPEIVRLTCPIHEVASLLSSSIRLAMSPVQPH